MKQINIVIEMVIGRLLTAKVIVDKGRPKLAYFTSLNLCKYSQIPKSSLRIASIPNRIKTNHH